MKVTNYSMPQIETHKVKLRVSILAGSDSNTKQVVTGCDFDFDVRKRGANGFTNGNSID